MVVNQQIAYQLVHIFFFFCTQRGHFEINLRWPLLFHFRQKSFGLSFKRGNLQAYYYKESRNFHLRIYSKLGAVQISLIHNI